MNIQTGVVTYEQVLFYARQLPFIEQDKLIAQLTNEQYENLEQACQQALAFGQDPEIVQQVRERKMNPVMLAYGLLKDNPDFEHLIEEVYQNRQQPSTRKEVCFEDY